MIQAIIARMAANSFALKSLAVTLCAGVIALIGAVPNNITDWQGRRAMKGANPFDHVTLTSTGAKLSTIVPVYDPPFWDSTQVYRHIADNLGGWIEHAWLAQSGIGKWSGGFRRRPFFTGSELLLLGLVARRWWSDAFRGFPEDAKQAGPPPVRQTPARATRPDRPNPIVVRPERRSAHRLSRGLSWSRI